MQKGQKNYLVFNVTEHVHLYCNSLKSISVLNLCVFAVYIFYRKTWFSGVIFLPHLFRQEFSSIYLHNVYHKAPNVFVHTLCQFLI